MMRLGIPLTRSGRSLLVQVAIAGTSLGLAFYAGRATSPETQTEAAPPQRRLSSRVTTVASANEAGPVTSGAQFEKLYSATDENPGARALGKMNATEVERLVRSLVEHDGKSGSSYASIANAAAWQRWAELDPDAALAGAAEFSSELGNWALPLIFATMAEKDPALAEAKLSSVREPLMRAALRTAVMNALAIKDPDAWLARITADSSSRNGVEISMIVSQWAENPATAIARISKLPANLRREAISALGSSWAGENPTAAMAWAQSLPAGSERNAALKAVVTTLADSDPEAALATLDSLPFSVRENARARAFAALGKVDFEKAFQRASSLPDAKTRNGILERLISDPGPSPANAEKFQSLVMALPSGENRTSGISSLAAVFSTLPGEDSQIFLNRCREEDRQTIQRMMVTYLSETNPKGALDLLESLPPGVEDTDGTGKIAVALVQEDPEAAMRFALGRQTPNDRAECVKSLFEELVGNNPETALTRLQEVAEEPVRKAAVEAIAEAWVKNDPTAAMTWAASLEGADRNAALDELIPTFTRSNPRAAADFVASQAMANPNDGTLALVRKVASSWSQDDCPAASEWAMALPDGQAKLSAIDNVASNWVNTDPAGAERWLNALPAGDSHDAAAESMSRQIGSDHPALGLRWAMTISDDESRFDTASSVWSEWHDSDPQAAMAAIKSGGFSPAMRQRFLKELEQEE